MDHNKATHKFGRKPRQFNPSVPHLSSLKLATPPLSPPPLSVDYSKNMTVLGMMLNDKLGCCTCSAYYHARQIWTLNASGLELTEPDTDVEKLYEQACSYQPWIPGPGPGGDEQSVLSFLLNTGAPVGPNGEFRDKILAFLEVDPKKVDDVQQTIYECGVAYIGFPVPENVTYDNPVWDFNANAGMTNEGHAVVLVGYDQDGAIAISWGKLYKMTWSFITNVVDEVYAIVDNSWVCATGLTPAGLSIAQLEAQMQIIKAG